MTAKLPYENYKFFHSKIAMIDPSKLPEHPGCYLFKDATGEIIYVGKARNLRKRVKSYFQKNDLDPKTMAMVKRIDFVDFIVTDNEVEALILENNLIKKNKPKYNIDLKDSKRYAYIELTDEKFPRLLVARRRVGTGKFFGPFVSAAARDYILSALKKTFQVRTCKRMPKKPCLRHQIDLCQAPCIGKINSTEYSDRMKVIELILKGKTDELIKSKKNEILEASAELDFEHALELRNQIEAIEWLKEKQNVQLNKKYDEDIINYIVRNDRVYLILFNIYKGILENKQEFEFDCSDKFLEEFLVQYYSGNTVPTEIILPREINGSLISFLRAKRGDKVSVKVPKIGDKKQLLDLVRKNIEASFFSDIEKLDDLKDKLHLTKPPIVIECFDISHISGTSTVGSMVQFRNALPDKSNYRRFKIRTVEGIDDTRAIGEIVRRRYARLLNEGLDLPDLIVIDGGIGQLNSGARELKKLGLEIPIISIAKRLEEVYLLELAFPLKLPKKSKALKLIQQIRDEAHRFAISYSRLLHKKELLK
ncbi:MAG: excinuclease ABC subunit C [Candidatus Argoarchaeum ethanivorans]|uniref:UvrABC system protein C n=1 Tax=Candidatus Argoarchaeum ethanivorans TaxID=2608793 RepID=A0A8B3S262_9EURY|nr:MAG: excinuclease ABC subunit C [Candidatus Argoarchaeum ethanivorans]